ncbi:uncharacterized protein THITE_2076347 [Thermothielavioides terrestris NRRL 8126]|uniref:SURF1-like protein n=1 Tax=Thermothielavioides terrestris (strain ATCC 38088 / NRRL 8126) TaxID=578455 RepID=G2R3Q3_THETT|nr:uncharacterized protein THITE_2076347 [Thermothielavioides terrestris NRRL 8126]AEO65153.1 hypothetical protein THITE_2076347 [Thermothielavioides terrestris NRRL 8126]
MAAARVFTCVLRPLQGQQRPIGRALSSWPRPGFPSPSTTTTTTTARLLPPLRRTISSTPRRPKQAADEHDFTSIVDNPPELVRVGRKHGPGLIILALIPATAFILGTWQVQRLKWKTDLIAKCEDRLVRPPLPLPPRVDPDAVAAEFDYRRVYTTGRFRHDQEMLVGPRMRDGEQGYLVVTPLERGGGGKGDDGEEEASKILVNRGWVAKKFADQSKRAPAALPTGEVTVEGLLRQPWKKNMFTPENRPDKGEFYFPDVKQMAELTGSQPVWVEQTMEPDYIQFLDHQDRGIPLGTPAEVNLRNNHAQYIFTW